MLCFQDPSQPEQDDLWERAVQWQQEKDLKAAQVNLCFHDLKIPFLAADDTKFSEAVQTLLTWIERGEVNRRTANNFYSMIQSANSHIRRLVNEKAAHEKEMEEAKEKFKLALSGILVQCE